MLLAGLLAGGLTASTALSDVTVDQGLGTHMAAASPGSPALTGDGRVAASATTVAAIRIHETAVDEADLVRTAPAAASRSKTPHGAFVRPAPGGITGPFGERRRSHIHPGVDYDGETGDPVVAAATGTVAYAGTAPSGYSGYGQMILIDHGDGVFTLYAHLSRMAVASGMTVGAGDHIGAIGTTGNVTGSHLHFELRLGTRPVDPAGWFAR